MQSVQSWCQKRNGNDPGSVWLFFLATLSKMFYSVVCVRVHMCMCWDGVNWYVLMYSQWLWTILHTYKDISIKRVRERMREKAHNLPGKQTRIGQSKWNYTSKLLKSTCSVSRLLSLSLLLILIPCKIELHTKEWGSNKKNNNITNKTEKVEQRVLCSLMPK